MTLHLVLDHSALIPCGNKPEEEKEAIKKLGNVLPERNVVWYVSREYLKTLCTVLSRELKHHHPLPKLQASLERTMRNLLGVANTKRWHCKCRKLSEASIELHVIARSTLEYIGKANPELREELEDLKGIDNEDREVLAIAIVSTNYARPVYLVTADDPFHRAANQLIESTNLEIEVLTPKQLEKRLRQVSL